MACGVVYVLSVSSVHLPYIILLQSTAGYLYISSQFACLATWIVNYQLGCSSQQEQACCLYHEQLFMSLIYHVDQRLFLYLLLRHIIYLIV